MVDDFLIYDEEKKESYISYYDEHNIIRSGYFHIISFNPFLIRFRTNKEDSNSIITVPTSRILKVKEKEGVKKDGERRIID